MAREFSVVRELSRRELERHQKRFIGVTSTEPTFIELDTGGKTEWVCDVRVGVREGWALVRNCLIAQWALGAVTDINVPVLCERSESGRVTVIARSEINLPDIALDTYSYEDLDFEFMRNLKVEADGSVIDGFGYEIFPAGTGQVQTPSGEEGQTGTEEYVSRLIEWGSTDFDYGVTDFGERVTERVNDLG